MRVLRELKKGELTLKDMSTQRETLSAREQFKRTSAMIKDYSLQHVVQMGWRENETDRDLRPFQLQVDDKKYRLSWGELKDMDLAGFFRREKGNPKTYRLKFFDGSHVTLDTGLNDDAERDMIVRVVADDSEFFLDWYEILRAGRFI